MTGVEFKQKRELLGLSQVELAMIMEVTERTVSRLENLEKVSFANESAILSVFERRREGRKQELIKQISQL